MRHQAALSKGPLSAGRSLLTALALLCAPALTSCGGLGYTPPPGAKLGDAFLALTVSTQNSARMPQGADVVISIENAKASDPTKRVIIGDVIKLTQSDTAVKVNFPVDRHKLAGCGQTIPCEIHVKIMKEGTARFKSEKAISYKAGQSSGAITVTKQI